MAKLKDDPFRTTDYLRVALEPLAVGGIDGQVTQSMNTIYCEWNSAFFALDRGKMPKLMSIEQARQRHERRQAYEAIVMKSGEPHYVISVEGSYLSVAFIDDCDRCYLEYDFQEKQPNRLFLTHATHREFIGDSDELSNWKLFAFE